MEREKRLTGDTLALNYFRFRNAAGSMCNLCRVVLHKSGTEFDSTGRAGWIYLYEMTRGVWGAMS